MASALSLNDIRVNRLEFNSGVADLEMPVDSALLIVAVFVPCAGF